MFKKTTKYGPILLGAWLIATGAKAALGGVIPVAGPILGLLAVAAGILILMDR
jgi:hypothetical protein